MDLTDLLKKIQDGLRTGKYVNEAAISVQVLLPLLRKLGWPDDDPETVRPEYSVGGQRVDYALFVQSMRPLIFIEVKRPGKIEGGDAQLFEYAYKQGIPIAILTDGQEWYFYLPCEQGEISERCVYKLDIVERTTQESISRLQRYLGYQRVCEGKAIEDAKVDYQDKTRNRDMERTLPRAWKKILEEQDSILIDLLAETVEDLCGYKPNSDITADFIKEILNSYTSISSPKTTIRPPEEKTKTYSPKLPRKRSGGYGFILYGQENSTENTARGVLIAVLEKLQEKDSSFLERFKSRKHGRKRRYVADTKEDLYPGRPDLYQNPVHFRQLSTGDYVGTNYSKKTIKDEIIKLAAEVAGIKYGVDLIILFGNDDI